MSSEFNGIVKHHTKKVGEAENVWARLFRGTLADIGMTTIEMTKKLNSYLDDPRRGGPRDGASRSSDRGNLIKALSQKSMTWNIFEQGMRVCNPLSFKIILEIRWPFNKQTTRSVVINVRDDNIAPTPKEDQDIQHQIVDVNSTYTIADREYIDNINADLLYNPSSLLARQINSFFTSSPPGTVMCVLREDELGGSHLIQTMYDYGERTLILVNA